MIFRYMGLRRVRAVFEHCAIGGFGQFAGMLGEADPTTPLSYLHIVTMGPKRVAFRQIGGVRCSHSIKDWGVIATS